MRLMFHRKFAQAFSMKLSARLKERSLLVLHTSTIHHANVIHTCFQLLTDKELSDTVKGIYLTILDKLCLQHFHTALDIAQTGKIYLHYQSL